MSASRRLLVAFTLFAPVAVAVAGCGHSESPVAPFDTSTGVPVPRSVRVQGDAVGRLVVTWQATAEDRLSVDGWFVERRTSTESVFTRLEATARADTAFFDDEVVDGVRYAYRVIAVTGAGVASVPAETPPVRADRTGPTAPTAVTAQSAPGGVRLEFTDGGEPDLAFFEVRLTLPQTNLPPTFRQVAGSPATLTGLVAESEYAFEIAAIDSAGRTSPYSEPPVTAIAGP